MRYFYFGLLLLTSLLWAGNFIVGKWLVGHASPMTLTMLRWLIAVVVLFPIVWKVEKKLLPSRRAVFPLILMGLTGVVLFNVLQFMALELTSATNVGLISTLIALSIAFFSFVFLKEKVSFFQIAAMFLSVLGVLLVLTNGKSEVFFTLQFNLGDVFMIGAVCIWGLYVVLSKWAMNYTSPLMATLYSGIFGILILLPFTFSDFAIKNLNATFIYSLLYTGGISTVVCIVLWNIGVKKLGATTAGLFLNFNPVFTVILAFFVLGERMSFVQIMGSAIVITGCYLFTFFKHKDYSFRKLLQFTMQRKVERTG
ncbi:permease of the drug/metabolite transporter [Halalkalibacter wakoensis JCM 9140]|uniref:Permease of the drug/metabolite transporter n=1 Tax=Halalkalibacter wakoensis JCM 9140 TaxID=1236970 RepID=W4Q941_9BACI|nr:DMT family transporter [Halalkalibacter wakoensis]GAE28510.1 permease of the drug/metabolite transporter [Halalkalibacter wakoensis JCM 9140]